MLQTLLLSVLLTEISLQKSCKSCTVSCFIMRLFTVRHLLSNISAVPQSKQSCFPTDFPQKILSHNIIILKMYLLISNSHPSRGNRSKIDNSLSHRCIIQLLYDILRRWNSEVYNNITEAAFTTASTILCTCA